MSEENTERPAEGSADPIVNVSICGSLPIFERAKGDDIVIVLPRQEVRS